MFEQQNEEVIYFNDTAKSHIRTDLEIGQAGMTFGMNTVTNSQPTSPSP